MRAEYQNLFPAPIYFSLASRFAIKIWTIYFASHWADNNWENCLSLNMNEFQWNNCNFNNFMLHRFPINWMSRCSAPTINNGCRNFSLQSFTWDHFNAFDLSSVPPLWFMHFAFIFLMLLETTSARLKRFSFFTGYSTTLFLCIVVDGFSFLYGLVSICIHQHKLWTKNERTNKKSLHMSELVQWTKM